MDTEKERLDVDYSDFDMVKVLQEKFREDPLYRELLADNELRKKLFPDFVKELHPTKQYTTLEVSEMVGEKDSTVRYYMNTLLDYIQPIRNNRNYRLTYESVYKLHLVFLFTRDYGRNTSDVKGLLPEFGHWPIAEGKVVTNREVSVKRETRSNEGLLLAFLFNLTQENEELQYELHNGYIDYIQMKSKQDRINQKIRSKVKEISDKKDELAHKKDELNQKRITLERLRLNLFETKGVLRADAQMKNLEIAMKTVKEKETLSAKIKKIFKKEEEQIEFFYVKEDDPKIQAQKEEMEKIENEINQMENEINKYEEVIEHLKEEIEELEKQEDEYVTKIEEKHNSLIELVPQLLRLKSNPEMLSLLSGYFDIDENPEIASMLNDYVNVNSDDER